jgi:ferredoxin-NADP reductase
MRSPERLQFRAGQFVSMGVGQGAREPQDPNDPVEKTNTKKRSYSIASPSEQGQQLRFIVRVIPEGTASEFLILMPLGQEVRMTGPHGFFVLDAEHSGDVVFAATGTGVSAVMPMLSELSRRPVRGRRCLYWGVRNTEDLFARQEIESLCRAATCDLVLCVSNPPPNWAGHSGQTAGRITAAILDELPAMVAPTFYLVGNGTMISDLKRALVARGIDRKKQIRTEAFFD